MFDAARLARLKPSAYLVNTARGGIVDEPALHAALTSGKLAGAGLDVFEQEPPPVGQALHGLPNVIMAPHVAGVTIEAVERMSEQTARNILSVLDGDPIRQNIINQEIPTGAEPEGVAGDESEPDPLAPSPGDRRAQRATRRRSPRESFLSSFSSCTHARQPLGLA